MISLALLLACSSSKPEAPPDAVPPDAVPPAVPAVGFALAFSGNVDGEIEPCG